MVRNENHRYEHQKKAASLPSHLEEVWRVLPGSELAPDWEKAEANHRLIVGDLRRWRRSPADQDGGASRNS
jgi:hypothetical protein